MYHFRWEIDVEDDWDTLIATERRDRILGVLRTSKGVYLEDAIPARKLANARETMQLPPDERVLALIDCTTFGSAKNGIVFGERAMYWHNAWTVGDPAYRGAGTLDYPRLARLALTKSFLEVRWPGGALEVSGSDFVGKSLLALLQQLQQAILYGTLPERVSTGGTYIAPHLVTRDCLEPTNEVWPNGIGANADASTIELPLTLRWQIELSTWLFQPLAVVRDFAVAVLTDPHDWSRNSELVGLELTSGRIFWRRELTGRITARLVADLERIYARVASEWFAFDLESGEPHAIEVASLDPRIRQQLVLATAWLHSDFEQFSAFNPDLEPPADGLKLIAANGRYRVYAPYRVDGFSSPITIVSSHGTFEIALESDEAHVLGCAIADRHVVLAQGDGHVQVIDAAASPPTVVQRFAIPAEETTFTVRVSVGSDHVVIARNRHVRCFRHT